jgi:hypothetical protein
MVNGSGEKTKRLIFFVGDEQGDVWEWGDASELFYLDLILAIQFILTVEIDSSRSHIRKVKIQKSITDQIDQMSHYKTVIVQHSTTFGRSHLKVCTEQIFHAPICKYMHS